MGEGRCVDTGNWLLMLLPIFAFAIVDWKLGPVKGALAAIVIGILVVIADYFLNGFFDEMMMIEVALIVVLGLATVKSNNPNYVRQQPTITAGFIAAFLASFQFWGTPFLVKYIPRMQKIADPTTELGQSILHQTNNPAFVAAMGRLSGLLIWVFLLHGVLMYFAGRKFSRKGWVACRLLIYPMVLVVMVKEMYGAMAGTNLQ